MQKCREENNGRLSPDSYDKCHDIFGEAFAAQNRVMIEINQKR